MIIVPSILSDSLEVVSDQLRRVRLETVLNRVQIDIIDPEFADETTIHPIDLLETNTQSLEIDFHLMTNDPIQDVVECSQVPGAHAIIAQIERMRNQHDFIEHVESFGIYPGFSLDLYTQVEEINEACISKLNYIQVMGNKAGKQGQQFMGESIIKKISALDTWRKTKQLQFQIIVDIGMSPDNAASVVDAGADIITPGSFLWTSSSLQDAIESYAQKL